MTLEAALDLAWVGPDMRLAEARVEVARAEFAAATAPLAGELRAGLEGGWTSVGEGAWSAPFEVSLLLNVLPVGPAHERAVRAALELEHVTAEYRDVWARTVISVARVFLTAVRAEEELELNREHQGVARGQLDALLRRGEAGDATPAEVRAAEREVMQADAAALTSEHTVATALASLEALIGQRINSVTAGGYSQVAMAGVMERLTSGARSDVAAARARVAGAELDLSAARRGAAPFAALSVTASHASLGGELGVGLAFDTREYRPRIDASIDPVPGQEPGVTRVGIGVGAALPVGEGTSAALAAAGARLDLARGQLDLVLIQATNDVAAKRRAVELAELRVEQTRRLERASAAAAAELATRRLLGLATLAEYQAAELDLGRARLDLARAEDALLIARLELAHAQDASLPEGP